MAGLPDGEKSLRLCLGLRLSTQYMNVTDGRTDGEIDRRRMTARAALAELRGKKLAK